MKLCYRGVSYEHEPHPVEFSEGDVIGRYRGCPLRAHMARSNEFLEHLSAMLTYRGRTYQH